MSGQNSSYLENKLRSLRGPSTGVAPAQGYTATQNAGYPTINTVSSGLGYTTRLDSAQPSFVNRDYAAQTYAAPLASTYQPPVLSTAPIRITSSGISSGSYGNTYAPGTYTPAPVYASPTGLVAGTGQYSGSLDSMLKPAYRAPEPVRATDNYELKANPAIYSMMGYVSQQNAGPAPYSQLHVGPGLGAEDYRRLISVDHEHSIMEKLKGAILNITEDLDMGQSSGLQDAINTLREKLPREKENAVKLEKACVDDLLQDEQKKQELVRQIQEKETGMRSLGDNLAILEKNFREVAAVDSPGGRGAEGLGGGK